MLRDSLQKWVGRSVNGTVTLELRRGDDYSILNTESESLTYARRRTCRWRWSRPRRSARSIAIGQLSLRNLDIEDSREKLRGYVARGVLEAGDNVERLVSDAER